MSHRLACGARLAAGVVAMLSLGACAPRLTTAYDAQTYLPAAHNFAFRDAYPQVDRLFNAFDFGHAIVYERLVERRAPREIEETVFTHVTQRVLRRPPAVPLDESAVGPQYVRLAPELRAMFEWAHMLHRQLYDVCADVRLSPEARERAAAGVLRYYRSRGDLALSGTPKSMGLMESGPLALGFRRAHPKYNGLLWSYHWLQMGLYDALLDGRTTGERDANVAAVVAHFWALLADAPRTAPAEMPMSVAIAPEFGRRFPEAAIVFDNLHALHDVVGDILAAPGVTNAERRRLLLAAASAYRDDTTQATSVAEWRQMSDDMDGARMGGSAQSVFPRRRP